MTKAQALNAFWTSFGLPAYDEGTVPISAQMPYITYEVREDAIWHDISLRASLWYKGSSWVDIEAKTAEIGADIGLGGRLLHYDGGAVWIKRGSPFAQRVTDPDDDVRRILIQLEAEYISAD